MGYKLRFYCAMPGPLPALISRFRNHTLRIKEKHGICRSGF